MRKSLLSTGPYRSSHSCLTSLEGLGCSEVRPSSSALTAVFAWHKIFDALNHNAFKYNGNKIISALSAPWGYPKLECNQVTWKFLNLNYSQKQLGESVPMDSPKTLMPQIFQILITYLFLHCGEQANSPR